MSNDPFVPLQLPQLQPHQPPVLRPVQPSAPLPPTAFDIPSLGTAPSAALAPASAGARSAAYAARRLIVDTRARNTAIALLGAAALLVIGMISHAWFTARGGNVGLLGIEECHKLMCRSMSWFDVPRAPSELKLFATIGLLGGLAALGFLVQAAVVLFKNAPHRVMTKWLNGSLGLAAFGVFSFFFHLTFGEMSKKLSFGWAGFSAMTAIIGASVVIGTMLRPLTRTNR
jgi:hypothetical protein